MQIINLNPFNMTLKQVIKYVPKCAAHLRVLPSFVGRSIWVCGGQRELGPIFL